ncbi:hypothetical protein L228DRAFT_269213 [Xylona heveae TC161]|uniref:Uncharacterized protein n=1 Tax=Xylona heveae (strain CBS 132557 / TC161) TaxID=1328760 RepID=A0A165G5C6_XYLHT|nr:hypothetical protein L228DRAFT_269213 [Xylona heveae TC161]KZF21757.1 hypothetical protein L228DRAFT_269213 [Xylona heveae TC161]
MAKIPPYGWSTNNNYMNVMGTPSAPSFGYGALPFSFYSAGCVFPQPLYPSPVPPFAALPEIPQPPKPVAENLLPPGIDLEETPIDGSANYLFPKKHTLIHVVLGNHHPWEKPGQEFNFAIMRVPTSMTVKDVIHQLGATTGDNAKNGITEVLELGDGRWLKGISFFAADKKSEKPIADFGWDEKRGPGGLSPIWLAVHRA